MNPQMKGLILKEVKEVYGRKDYLLTMIINTVVYLGAGYIFAVASPTGVLQNLFMEFSFIVIPSFAMLIVGFPFIQEKFGDEKLIRRFEALLTTPISLKTVWTGKMASIFLLSYPVAIFAIVLLLFAWAVVKGMNPIFILSVPVWVMTLFIVPLLPMIYAGLSSWFILRFNHPQLMQVLQLVGIGISILIFLSSGRIIRSIATGHIVNWPIVAYSTIGVIGSIALIIFLISKLNKEKNYNLKCS